MEPLNFDGTAAASLYTRLYLRGAVHRQRHPNAVVRNVSFAVEGFRMALKHLWQTLKRSCVGDHQDYSMGYVITAENQKVVSGFLLKISTRSSIITRLYNSGALDVGVYQCGLIPKQVFGSAFVDMQSYTVMPLQKRQLKGLMKLQ